MTMYGFDCVHLIGSDLDAGEPVYSEMFGAQTTGRREANGSTNLTMRLNGVSLFLRSPGPAPAHYVQPP